jgi:hypothetical protein
VLFVKLAAANSKFGQMTRRIVLFELNEVPWRIVDEYVADQPGSALARILPSSRNFTSITADRGHLSPWTTWPTLHRGVNDEQHMIGSFGQDRAEVDECYPPVWQLLHEAGVSVGVCGSLHSYPAPEDISTYSFYLPDTFALEPTAFPAELEAFQEFNLTMVAASSRNVDTSIPRAAAVRFLRHTPKIGIRPRTFAALTRQLLAERRNPWMSTRRRSFQSIFAFDLFAKQLEQSRPAFSSFFTNHVASAMHRYWAAGHPGDYQQIDLNDEWMDRYRGEVPWAMARADEMVGRLATFVDANPEYELWIASSMGQGPTLAQPLETQLYLQDLAAFMGAVGLPPDSWSQRPAMLPQRNVQVAADRAADFEAALQGITVAGAPLRYRRTDNGFFSMEWGQPNLHDQADAVRVAGVIRVPAELGLHSVEIEERSDTTAYHVPQGVLAIYDPLNLSVKSQERPDVSVLDIAPTVLSTFGVAVPIYMNEPAGFGANTTAGHAALSAR